jgi:23S rRNA (adenine2503-C2)-methyltransferase
MGALFGLDLEQLTGVMNSLGQKPYRARQLFDALYKQRVPSLAEVTTFSQELRERLSAGGWTAGLPEILQTAISIDGTERYLIRMADGETVETVWMPDGDGGERGDGTEAGEEDVPDFLATRLASSTFQAARQKRGFPSEMTTSRIARNSKPGSASVPWPRAAIGARPSASPVR